MQTYDAHGYEVLDIAVSDDNARFVSVGGDKTVFLWDVASARTLRRWSGHVGRVNACAFGGVGGDVVVSGELDLLCAVIGERGGGRGGTVEMERGREGWGGED